MNLKDASRITWRGREAVRATYRGQVVWTPQAQGDPSVAIIQSQFGSSQIGTMLESRPTVEGQPVLYIDEAMTQPATSDGDPVFVRVDISGNGNHAVALSSSARAILRTDGTHWWLEYSGSQGYIAAGVNWLSDAGDISQTSAMALRSADSTGYFAHAAGNVNHLPSTKWALLNINQELRWLFSTSSTANHTPYTPETDVVTSSAAARSTTADPIGRLSINGVEREATVSTGTDENGAPLTVGFRTPSNPAAFYRGRDYGLLVSSGYRPETLGQLNQYYANLAGVTL